MDIKFTNDQNLAIDATGTVLVSAAAGSGKTAVLTERVAKLICDKENGIDADKLLIVTFTNAAAAELRSRITKRVNELSLLHLGDSFYSKQKMLLQSAKICSIDAFCLDLVRKNFSSLNIEPDFSLIDDALKDRITNQVLDTVLLGYYTADDDDFNYLGRVFSVNSSEKALKDAIIKIYEYAITLPQPKKWLRDAVSHYTDGRKGYEFYTHRLLRDLIGDIDEAIAYCNIAAREVAGTSVEAKLIDYYMDHADFLKQTKALINEEKYDALPEFLASCNFRAPAVSTKAAPPETVKELKAFNQKVGSNTKAIIAACLSAFPEDSEIENGRALVSKLCELVSLFYDEFFRVLKSKKMFTFSMVEHLALELLCREEDGVLKASDLAKDICKNYKAVLVDEYQDNNDLQDALFFAVSDGGKNLFMVGDVKQCVYGFRNANPDNFLKYKNKFPLYKQGNKESKIIFKSNFRSRSGVCDFVNAFCSAVVLESVSGMSYSEEDRLVAGATFPDIKQPAVEVNLINNASKGRNETVEAEEIAAYIEKVMNEGAVISSKSSLRNAKYSDFAILMRSPKSRHTIYENALKRRGIPVSVMSDSFTDSPEVMAVIALLAAINNPSRDIPLAAAMTSAFFGFTYDDMVDIKRFTKSKNLYSAVLAMAQNGNSKCNKFLKELSDLRSRAVTEPLGRFIADICDRYLITAVYGKLSDFKAVSDNINKIVSLADAHYSAYGNDLDSFIRNLESQSDIAADTLSGNSDTVKLMSFHKSKGLQFPICIIAAAGGRFTKIDLQEKYIFSNVFGISVKQPGKTDFSMTAAGETIKKHRLKLLIAEEIRIFYVALTRAEDRLVIFGTSRDLKKDIIEADLKLRFSDVQKKSASARSVLGAKSYLDLLLLSLIMQSDGGKILSYAGLNRLSDACDARFAVTITDTAEAAADEVKALSDEESFDFVSDPELRERLEERFNYEYPFKHECLTPSKFAVTSLVHGDSNQYSFSAKPAFMSKSGLTPAERGTAMHKFMQFADFGAAEIAPEAELERLKEWEFLSGDEADSIKIRFIKMFFESDIYKRMVNSKELYREYKFMVEYPYGETKTIVQGIADCVFKENDELVIFDFKTDSVRSAEELKERYAKQLEIYKYALESVFDTKVKECVLFALKLGDYVSF